MMKSVRAARFVIAGPQAKVAFRGVQWVNLDAATCAVVFVYCGQVDD
jgi:hypothetical protein